MPPVIGRPLSAAQVISRVPSAQIKKQLDQGTKSGTDWSKYLLYGLGAVGVFLVARHFTRKRKVRR